MEIKAVFRRKDTEIEATDCVVDAVVRLPGAQYDSFSRNLTRDWDFIRDNPIDTIVDAQGRHHCLLVLGDGRRDGILVNAEGGSYARYSAFLPGAADLYVMDRYPSLAGLMRRLDTAVDYVISLASTEWRKDVNADDPDKYAVSFHQMNNIFSLPFGGDSMLTELFTTMLMDRAEIEGVRFNTEEFLVDANVNKLALAQEQEHARDTAPLHTDKEFAAWKNQCDGIPGSWREDKRYRQKKEGALYYLGGENGQYILITGGGNLTVGRYELARPGIEDAILFGRATQQYGSYEQAFLMASQLAGQRFVTDIFSEKPSVMDKIREARKTPAPPSPKADKVKDKGSPGVDL